MPIKDHPSFVRPPASVSLWRYVDLPKFTSLLTSQSLWLTNVEVLAESDPREGLLSPVQFPHRIWTKIGDIPQPFRNQVIQHYGKNGTPEEAFKSFMMTEEQLCTMNKFGRRDYYVSCWHAAQRESIAMWKIYASPGAGVAIVTNEERLEDSLRSNERDLYLGGVKYVDPDLAQIGPTNGFDNLMVKRDSFSYEREVRLVHWDTSEVHDALKNFKWNPDTLRFEDIIEDTRPITQGISFPCNIEKLVEKVIVSPFCPPWYLSMIRELVEKLELSFDIVPSKLLNEPELIP